MIVAHLLEPGGGGTMRHVLDLAQQQAHSGAQIHVIYSPVRLEPLFAPQLQAMQNVTLHILPMRRAPHVSDIENLFALIKLLKQIQPDVLHAHSTKAGLLARLARLFIKAKIIYTPHALMTLDPETSALKKFCYGLYEKLFTPLTDRMIVLSMHEYNHARELGIPAAKLVTGLNGAAALPPTDRDAIRRSLNATDDIVIGFVGRLSRQKNPELAIRAFAAAQAENPKLKLVIIGDGELRGACETLAQSLNIQHRILWLGAVNAAEYYAGMDLLLITSRYEGMAYSYLEALQAGLPIVTTPVGGSDSCVIHGQTGIIAQTENDIAAAILQIANDAVLRDAMRFAARALARHFTLPQMLEIHTAIYAEALAAPE